MPPGFSQWVQWEKNRKLLQNHLNILFPGKLVTKWELSVITPFGSLLSNPDGWLGACVEEVVKLPLGDNQLGREAERRALRGSADGAPPAEVQGAHREARAVSLERKSGLNDG